MARVSVIVPNYNHAPYLRQRIDSILAQTYEDFDVLILDDCSQDDSRRVIASYAHHPRVRFAFNDRNSGSSYMQWCKGIELTGGEYIWIAESDDFADAEFLERLCQNLDEDPELGLAFCETIVVDESGEQLGWYVERSLSMDGMERYVHMLNQDFVLDGNEYIKNFMIPWNSIPNASAVLFRRSALLAVGGPVTSMRLCGDWLTYCKILSRFKVGHIADRLNFFREHTVNVRSNTRGETIAKEWLDVANWVNRAIGGLSASTRRQLDSTAAEGLLHMERRVTDHRVPFARMPTALARALRVSPRLVLPTAKTLLRQSLGAVVRQAKGRQANQQS